MADVVNPEEESAKQSKVVAVTKPKNNSKKVLAVFAVLVLASLVGAGIYTWQHNQVATLDTQVKDLNKQVSDLKDSQKKDDENKATAVTPAVKPQTTTVLSGALTITLPTGWTKISDADGASRLQKGSNQIQFALFPTDDPIKNCYTGAPCSLVGTTTTAKGTKLYIVKNKDYVFLSACAPTSNSACSIKVNGQYAFILLHAYKTGDQYVRELDFNSAATTAAITDFTAISQSLNI